jgi:RimK-like ATP-grasp domain
MTRERLLIVGLEESEVREIVQNISDLVVTYDALPNIRLIDADLYVESTSIPDKYLKVDKVIYHGIYENDFDFITLLALWDGKCLPNASAMMDLRLRHSGLVRSLKASKFKNLKRGMSIKAESWKTDKSIVAKWGNWHCGENKHLFDKHWDTTEATLFEPFIDGEAVRIMLVGDKAWQIHLDGDDWKKSIHHQDAVQMEIDEDLLEDAKAISKYFDLEIVGIDYMIDKNNNKYLLEVNHIPNVTVFDFVNKVYLKYAADWVNQ